MSSPVDGQGEYLIVARARRPHGVRGALRVAIDTDRPKHVFGPGKRLQVADANGTPNGRSLTIESVRLAPDGGILQFEGLTRREDAEALRGTTFVIPASEAQPAAKDEVHYRDLIGLHAVVGGDVIGTVEDILEMPAREMLVVRGERDREILVPFAPDIVRSVDLAAREIRLELPEGLLDL